MRDFPVTAVHACVRRDGEQAGCVTFQSQLCMHVCDVMGSRQVRDFPVTAVHACVCRDGEHAGCVTFQSQLCMHVCAVMVSMQGA